MCEWVKRNQLSAILDFMLSCNFDMEELFSSNGRFDVAFVISFITSSELVVAVVSSCCLLVFVLFIESCPESIVHYWKGKKKLEYKALMSLHSCLVLWDVLGLFFFALLFFFAKRNALPPRFGHLFTSRSLYVWWCYDDGRLFEPICFIIRELAWQFFYNGIIPYLWLLSLVSVTCFASRNHLSHDSPVLCYAMLKKSVWISLLRNFAWSFGYCVPLFLPSCVAPSFRSLVCF
jgi:hypothetical protein